jgi:hypothetical protein
MYRSEHHASAPARALVAALFAALVTSACGAECTRDSDCAGGFECRAAVCALTAPPSDASTDAETDADAEGGSDAGGAAGAAGADASTSDASTSDAATSDAADAAADAARD